ncbi:MAG: aminomethyl-transferring glycine dehydrogenase subunit GcvPA [Desulfobacterales bacterium]|jgi:glycine dehydrogenase subunit 1|nr:aminomethyl-transferring glycine dehydrogenase subunit GcvPA [Desulfobacterales bacterium]
MRYLPHTDEDIDAMLKAIGAKHLDDLFSLIPEDCKRLTPVDLPAPFSEWELNDHMNRLASMNATSSGYKIFAGAGSYHHFIPETVTTLIGRGEFSTAYTPYQPEISQGTLQAIYEYQTYVTRLLGMDVANASMYDGASALAEALLMAIRITKRQAVAISDAIHPLYRQVVQTYLAPAGYHIVRLPYQPDGRTDLSALTNLYALAAVAIQSPNFFGCIEDLTQIGVCIHTDPQTLFVTAFAEPLAYGLIKNPGDSGADIACGEGQSLGIPQCFGGPGLGMFATKTANIRNLPGRLVGKTTDRNGQRGFVLTLATREQHIRRERATSNICSNQGLCATASVMYMASLGGSGIRELAHLNYDKAAYLKNAFRKIGVGIAFDSPTFNEFVALFPSGFEATYNALLHKKIVAGIPLKRFYPELTNHYLFCVTETTSREDMDLLVREVQS